MRRNSKYLKAAMALVVINFGSVFADHNWKAALAITASQFLALVLVKIMGRLEDAE